MIFTLPGNFNAIATQSVRHSSLYLSAGVAEVYPTRIALFVCSPFRNVCERRRWMLAHLLVLGFRFVRTFLEIFMIFLISLDFQIFLDFQILGEISYFWKHFGFSENVWIFGFFF